MASHQNNTDKLPFKMVLSAKLTVISEADEEASLTKNHLAFPPTYQVS